MRVGQKSDEKQVKYYNRTNSTNSSLIKMEAALVERVCKSDMCQKVPGSNPSAGKVFSREVSDKYHLLFMIVFVNILLV